MPLSNDGASADGARARAVLAALNELFLIAMLAVIAGILSTAMAFQFGRGELPCPLCLLERVAMFGVCFGIMLNFRHGFSDRNTGISLIFAVLLLVIATRQTLLDIYPRPGHAYIGQAIFGIHMPVWSIIIALAIITAFAVKLAVIGGDGPTADGRTNRFPLLGKAAAVVGLYVLAICAVNFGAVVLQCGLSECHTTGYRLLDGAATPG